MSISPRCRASASTSGVCREPGAMQYRVTPAATRASMNVLANIVFGLGILDSLKFHHKDTKITKKCLHDDSLDSIGQYFFIEVDQ